MLTDAQRSVARMMYMLRDDLYRERSFDIPKGSFAMQNPPNTYRVVFTVLDNTARATVERKAPDADWPGEVVASNDDATEEWLDEVLP